MNIAEKLNELGLSLPTVPAPAGAYRPAVRAGSLVFVAGQLPTKDGTLTHIGQVPNDVSLPDAQYAARLATLNALAALHYVMDPDETIQQVLRLDVFVNSAPDFTQQPTVANAASNLLEQLFGPQGTHARIAVGAAQLPANAPVELALIVQVAPKHAH